MLGETSKTVDKADNKTPFTESQIVPVHTDYIKCSKLPHIHIVCNAIMRIH